MGILENAKEVARAVEGIHNLELYQRVLALHSDIIQIVEDNNKLREENKELKRTIALRRNMTFREPFYYQEGDKTPFCPACWEAKNTAVHVTLFFDRDDETRWNCPSCKHYYSVHKNAPNRGGGFGPSGEPTSWMR